MDSEWRHTCELSRFEPRCSNCWLLRWQAKLRGAMELVTYTKFQALDRLRGWKERRRVHGGAR